MSNDEFWNFAKFNVKVITEQTFCDNNHFSFDINRLH